MGCIGEQEDGMSGGGYFCCCHDGKTPLENRDYDPRYKPVNGLPPPEFRFFGDLTKGRWLNRYRADLAPSVSIHVYSTAGTRVSGSLINTYRVINTETGEIW